MLESPTDHHLFHIGVVIARDDGRVLDRRAHALEPVPGLAPLGKQRDVAHIAAHHQMIVRSRPEIFAQRRQQFHAVLAPANQRQVERADGPLAEEIAQPRAGKAADMQIGHVGKAEH